MFVNLFTLRVQSLVRSGEGSGLGGCEVGGRNGNNPAPGLPHRDIPLGAGVASDLRVSSQLRYS